MNFESILACLENPEKRNEYIARLKSAGPNSEPVLHLKNSMEGVHMNKPPKHIFETTMLQHTFKYCDPLECFLQFRLVCKPWQNAIETIKFDRNRSNDDSILKHHANYPTFVKKYLQTFKKLKISRSILSLTDIDWVTCGAMIVDSMKQLKTVTITPFAEVTLEQQSFIQAVVKNNHKTLDTINLSDSNFLFPDINFPRVVFISLCMTPDTSSAQHFVTNFPRLLKKMENVSRIFLLFLSDFLSFDVPLMQQYRIYEYISENYAKHCIAGNSYSTTRLDYFPLKILKGITDLNKIQNKKYNNELQYLEVKIALDENDQSYDLAENGWDQFQEIFDQCSKLKQIALHFKDDDGDDIEFEDLPKNEQNIWEEKMQYFKKRKIEIVDYDYIVWNKELESKLKKEAGIKWTFCFN